jgi:hypothetical protein
MDYEKETTEYFSSIELNPYLIVCTNLLKFCEKVLRNKTSLVEPKEFHKVSIFFLSKNCRTFSAIIELIEKGFVEDALILARTLFEGALNYSYIAKDSEKHTKLYLEFAHVEKNKFLCLTKKIKFETTKFDKFEKEIFDNYQKVKENYQQKRGNKKSIKNWHKKDNFLLAKETEMTLLYWLIYKLHSQFTHTGAIIMDYFCLFEGDEITLDPIVRKTLYLTALNSSFCCLLRIVDEYINNFALEYKNEFEEIVKSVEIFNSTSK